eukprot:bmy_00289T0
MLFLRDYYLIWLGNSCQFPFNIRKSYRLPEVLVFGLGHSVNKE